jgi:hypothetical protein
MNVSRFDRNTVLKTPLDVTRLAERLAQCPEVSQFDHGDHKEAWALADSLSDLESSFREFLDELLPRIVSSEGLDLHDNLLDTAESFRHILYHMIVQQKFFRYVVPPATAYLEPPGPRQRAGE